MSGAGPRTRTLRVRDMVLQVVANPGAIGDNVIPRLAARRQALRLIPSAVAANALHPRKNHLSCGVDHVVAAGGNDLDAGRPPPLKYDACYPRPHPRRW